MAKHRGIEYRVIQGVQPRSWKWEISLPEGGTKSGQSSSKLEAIRAAERTIEKLFTPAKKHLVPPNGSRPR